MQVRGFLLFLGSALVCQTGLWWPNVTAPAPAQPAEIRSTATSAQAAPKLVAPLTVETTKQSSPTPDRAFANGQPLAARVNQQPLFLAAYQQRVALLEQARPEIKPQAEDYQAILSAMVDEQIVVQFAVTRGISVTNQEVEAGLAKESSVQLESWLVENKVSYEQFTDQLRQQWVANQVFEHITQEVPQNLPQIQMAYLYFKDEETASLFDTQEFVDSIFTEMSQESLVEPTSPLAYGALMWIPRHSGLIPAEVEAAAFSMQSGQISKPIQISSGFYIVKVTAVETTRPLTNSMLQMVKKQMFLDWLQEQRSLAEIEVYIGK